MLQCCFWCGRKPARTCPDIRGRRITNVANEPVHPQIQLDATDWQICRLRVTACFFMIDTGLCCKQPECLQALQMQLAINKTVNLVSITRAGVQGRRPACVQTEMASSPSKAFPALRYCCSPVLPQSGAAEQLAAPALAVYPLCCFADHTSYILLCRCMLSVSYTVSGTEHGWKHSYAVDVLLQLPLASHNRRRQGYSQMSMQPQVIKAWGGGTDW